MSRKSKYFKEIERLLDIGYEPKHIMKMTGIPKTTVYRIVEKLKTEARGDFKQTMSHNYLWMFQMNLANYSKTIQECNEEIVRMNRKYDSLELLNMNALEGIAESKPMAKATLLANLTNIQSNRTSELTRLVAQRDKASTEKAKVFNQGPVVYAINEWVNSKPPPMGELPRLPELDKINDVSKEIDEAMTEVDDISNKVLSDKLGANPPKLNNTDEQEDERVRREMEDE